MQEQTSEEPGLVFERPFIREMCEMGREVGQSYVTQKSSTSRIFHFNHDCQSEHVPFVGRLPAGDLVTSGQVSELCLIFGVS